MKEFWSNQQLSISVQSSDGTTITRHLEQPFALIGANSSCDAVIESTKVAQRALFVWVTSKGLCGAVLAENAKKAGRPFRIREGAAIQVRSWAVAVNVVQPVSDSETLTGAPVPTPEDQHGVYAITWKAQAGRQFLQLKDEQLLILGRKAPADLVLPDQRLSSVHCVVIRRGEELWAVDLQSSNGTWSQGRQRRVHRIKLDKSLCLGRQRVHFTRLLAEPFRQEMIEQLEESQQACADARRHQQATLDQAVTDQAALLCSLRLAEERAARQRHELETMIRQQDSLLTLQTEDLQTLVEIRDDLVKTNSELQAAIDGKALEEGEFTQKKLDLQQQFNETNERWLALHQDHQALQNRYRELSAQTANREMEMSLREHELRRMAEQLADQRLETEGLREKLTLERKILETLEAELRPGQDGSQSAEVEEDHCVASPDFHVMLDQALGALPRLDES